MHVVEIPSFFPPYGGLFCLDQAKALRSMGHEVRILSNVQLGATIGLRDYVVRPYHRFEHQMDGVTVCQSYQRGVPRAVRWNARRWVGIVCRMFGDYVAKYGRPDVLHAHCTKWAGYAAMRLGREYRLPYVVTEHLALRDYATELGMPPSASWQIPLLRESLQRAACVIPVSEEVVTDLSGYFGTDYRWQAIPNLIDCDFFRYRQRAPRQGRPFRFCCIGLLTERKGYDVLLRAFRRVQQEWPDAELHVAGRGTDSGRFHRLMVEAGVERGVLRHGEISKAGVLDVLYQSDALVLATRGETQGLALLEALSTGIPAISTEAIPPSVRPGKGCVFVPVDDVGALAEAMRRVVACPVPDGAELSETVCRMASPEVIARRIAAVLEASCRRQ